MVLLNQNSVKLCTQKKGSCCPIVERQEDGGFTISDDYNGKVKITKSELSMLKDAIAHFEKNV